MPVLFFDSSAIVKRYGNETGTAWVKSLVNPAAGNRINMSGITRVEVVSAIARKSRAGELSSADSSAAIVSFRRHLVSEYSIVEITSAVLETAMLLAENHALRGYDAVQLAAALELKDECLALGIPAPTLVSADTDLNTAASAEGLTADDPNFHP